MLDEFDFELSKYITQSMTERFAYVYSDMIKEYSAKAYDIAWKKVFDDAAYAFVKQRYGVLHASVFAKKADKSFDSAMKYIKNIELKTQQTRTK